MQVNMAQILVIEDNYDIAEMVCDYLESQGHTVDYAADGLGGLHLALNESFDVIVLDLMLPGMDGMTVCRRLRRDADIATPILMLTARDTLEDKIAGLDAGADDYMVKPFELEELDARLRALLRRASGTTTSSLLTVGDLQLDTGTMEAERDGNKITLTPIGLKLLIALLQASPKVVSRRDLEKAVWDDVAPDSDALRSHLYNLRKAIDKPFPKPLMQTVAGVGYRIVEPDD
ncbi:MAG: response regulator transcription factor, partial [Pseudomonadota bacterium]